MNDWQIDQFNEYMIRLKNDGNMLVLQPPSEGGYNFEEYDESGEHSLIWNGDVVRLIVTKFEEDGNIKMEITNPTNGFPIAMFNGLRTELFDDLAARAAAMETRSAQAQQPADRPSAAPAAGGRKTFKKKRLMSKKYCKKTPCKRMGFTQKASCRPYKNCYQ
jgi:hypothetical protein